MPRQSTIRIYDFPYHAELFGAYLSGYREERHGRRHDILLDFEQLEPVSVSEGGETPFVSYERVRGMYVPRTLRFTGASWVRRSGVLEYPERLPIEDPARLLFGALHWRNRRFRKAYFITTGAMEPAECVISARGCVLEPREGEPRPVELVRRWAYPPPQAASHRREPTRTQRRFGGDPIRIVLDGRVHRQRLFIGGVRHQTDYRPEVDGVLNLCELESVWAQGGVRHPDDRRARKGEMAEGMSMAGLLEEGRWVAERLRAGQRVLVHCVAGVNRSATVCCAALMLLEGISAEAALARVREKHPGCWPDPYHWFLLLRLHDAACLEAGVEAGVAVDGAPVLRTESGVR